MHARAHTHTHAHAHAHARTHTSAHKAHTMRHGTRAGPYRHESWFGTSLLSTKRRAHVSAMYLRHNRIRTAGPKEGREERKDGPAAKRHVDRQTDMHAVPVQMWQG